MNYIALQSVTGDKRILILALTEEELEPARPLDPSAYHYLALGHEDFFADDEELQHEHLIITTAPFHMTINAINNIIDQVLKLELQKETVRVLAVTPDIVRKLRNDPDESHTFELTHPLPEVVVLLGGEDRMNKFVEDHLRFEE